MKPGYKLTEVGVIPEDWVCSILSDFLSFISYGFTNPMPAVSDGIYMITATDINNGCLLLNGARQTSKAAYKNLLTAKSKPRQNDILLTKDGTLGRLALVRNEVICINQSVAVLRSNEKVFPAFLKLLLESPWYQSRMIEDAGGSTIKHIYITIVDKMPVGLPSDKEEQFAIATALSDMDALLDGLDRLIDKKRAIKQAVMQQLLTGQTRLPGFSGKWEMRRLDTLAFIHSGGTPSTNIDQFWDGTIPWCTPTDITQLNGSKYLTSTNRTITDKGLASSSAEMIPANSVVMTSRATIGECAINTVPVTTNQGFKNFVPFDSTDVEFFYYLLQTQKQGFIRLCGGSTFLEIGKTQLAAYEVQIPSAKSEQTAIAQVLTDMDAEITALEARRTKTHALKQAMMQELLTGRTRLVELKSETKQKAMAQTGGRQANVYFRRSVLAAEIIDQLHDQPTFGHVKFEKMIFVVEHLCDVDTNSHYFRQAAGPYDNRALRSIDSQLRKQQWFDARKEGERYRYLPMAKQGGHKPYFEQYFSKISETLNKIVDVFKTANTQQCEIVATLLAAWNDLLREKESVSDEMIVHEVLNNWHESKRQIPEDRWLIALAWMRRKGFVPNGAMQP
jgi:type I restriction enzyme S subunit